MVKLYYRSNRAIFVIFLSTCIVCGVPVHGIGCNSLGKCDPNGQRCFCHRVLYSWCQSKSVWKANDDAIQRRHLHCR